MLVRQVVVIGGRHGLVGHWYKWRKGRTGGGNKSAAVAVATQSATAAASSGMVTKS